MKRSSLALLTNLFIAPMAAYAQSAARFKQVSTTPAGVESEQSDEIDLAARSMFALKGPRKTY